MDTLYGGIPMPWTFKSWIANFKDVDLPIGDLAMTILRDPNFPDSEDFEILNSYIKAKGNNMLFQTFETVWNFYQASK